MVLPCASVMVIMVLLKVAFTCATPDAMFLRSRRRTRVASLPILDPFAARRPIGRAHLRSRFAQPTPGLRQSCSRADRGQSRTGISGRKPDAVGLRIGDFCILPRLLLLAGDRLGRTLAGAGIGMGALTAHRKATAMPQPSVAAEIH